jgi:phosphate transport system ATP-binding protein
MIRSESMTLQTQPHERSGDASAKLTIRNLNFYYGDFQALQDVSMPVHDKRVTALIGASGSGKSTLLRTFNRISETVPHSRIEGEILLDSENIFRMDVSVVRHRVGMVFQKSRPFAKSIFENVAFGLRLNGGSERNGLPTAVERSLRQAALWEEVKDRLHRPAHELSGGQQQRLCIARALAVDPDVLLLDEPCSDLDPASTAKIEELIFTLKANHAIVIVTHNIHQARRVADYTGFFLPGRLIEFNTTRAIFRDSGLHPHTVPRPGRRRKIGNILRSTGTLAYAVFWALTNAGSGRRQIPHRQECLCYFFGHALERSRGCHFQVNHPSG